MITETHFRALGGVTVSLHKLSAGSGYDYLTRQVAAQDSTELGRSQLADYYTAKGEAPGRWIGSGMVGIDGIEAGDVVTSEQMLGLFGHGCDPITEAPLGRRFAVLTDETGAEFDRRVKEKLQHLRADPRLDGADRRALRSRAMTDVARDLFVAQHGRKPANQRELDAALKRFSRPSRAAVSGFDLTFSPVKSVSTLWAIAPREIAEVIEQAHDKAVADALRLLEREALFTREGKQGARQVETRGLIATAFTHRDSRAGDPDLHTHVAVANKVQTKDGKWLSIYGRVLYESVVAVSETYNTALERHLVADLGLRFEERPDTSRGRPIREVAGVDPTLNAAWSKRRRDIVSRQGELSATFQRDHGRPPTQTEAIALAQQANLETRTAKHEPRSFAEQRATWRGDAITVLGSELAIDTMVDAALTSPVSPGERVTQAWFTEVTRRVITELESRRATWKPTHVRAEAQRQVRAADCPVPHIERVVDDLVNAVVVHLSIALTPDLDPIDDPDILRRSDNTRVYRHTGHDLYTSPGILAAEARIGDAAAMSGGRTVSPETVRMAVVEAAANGTTLNPGQVELVSQMATSGARLQVGIAAAGTGKTTAMRVLAHTWAADGGDVIGFAPSASAAANLQAETGIRSDTLAKLTHASGEELRASIGPRTLVVIDEAGMADTLSLDAAITHALQRGASVRLIGDDRQLSAVGAGGVLRDIAATHGAVRLDEVMRFSDPAEAAATLQLREGNTAALGFYLDTNRIHLGDATTCADDALHAWSTDRAAGLDSIMIAPTRDLVTTLNERARSARLGDHQPPVEVALADGTSASLGDTILTRRNDRRLATSESDWVKNGDRWTITGISDAGIRARHTDTGLHVDLPKSYVAEHVDLGYATTVHTAQGVTADTMHGIATGDESRQLLYTMLSRGRHANHLHLAIAPDGDPHQVMRADTLDTTTVTEVLEAMIRRDHSVLTAREAARLAASDETQLHTAVIRYADAVHAGAVHAAPPGRALELAQHAENCVSGITEEKSWASLLAEIQLREADGSDGKDLLEMLARPSILSGAESPADAMGRVLHEIEPIRGGPIRWLPRIPSQLAQDPTWGPYLRERQAQVADLRHVIRQTSIDETEPAAWAPTGAPLDRHTVADVNVWRAAYGITDPAQITGPPRVDFVERAQQRTLDRLVVNEAGRDAKAWIGPIVDIVGRYDGHTVALANELAVLADSGRNSRGLLTTAAAEGDLPDDHATAALHSRITRLAAPPQTGRTSTPLPRPMDRPEYRPDRTHPPGPSR